MERGIVVKRWINLVKRRKEWVPSGEKNTKWKPVSMGGAKTRSRVKEK